MTRRRVPAKGGSDSGSSGSARERSAGVRSAPVSAGYSGTPLVQKLGIREGMRLAALQAPVIMMSQNRQDSKDRLRGELDYDVNRRAEAEIQGLARKLNALQEQVGDITELLRRRQ